MRLEKTKDSVILEWEGDWNPQGYLLMPGAVYAGNRHRCVPVPYPPFVPKGELRGADSEILITDIPRLNAEDGPSEIRLRSGDLSTPAVGYYDPRAGKAVLLLGVHRTPAGYTGFEVHESPDRRSCRIVYTAFSVRPWRYTMCRSHDRSTDSPEAAAPLPEEYSLPYRLLEFSCDSVPALLDRFLTERKSMGEDSSPAGLPDFGGLMQTYVDKYNRFNWHPEEHYYRSGVSENLYQEWQSGWTGGGMFTLALYRAGDEQTRARVIESVDRCFSRFQGENGFFCAVYCRKRFYGDDFAHPEETRILMSRKQSDMLYYLLLQYREFGAGRPLWKEGLIRGLEAMARIYEKYGHWGQFLDTEREEIVIGTTASAGLMPGAFMLAYTIFGDPKYRRIALESGRYYYENFTAKGIANGGPGEILQCADSESAFALVESFVLLYEETGDVYWLTAAGQAADLFATWVVSYNFTFPQASEFGRLGIKTVGSVIANCQNKHSAPGIATMSGESLLRLSRYTGDSRYYELIRDIAVNIVQYTSTAEHPIRSVEGEILPPGFSCERVNMSDWEGEEWIGGVWNGSCCWCESAAMLTAVSPLAEEFGTAGKA